MDEKKIVFITCVNDEMEYAECRYYLERLEIPEGYSTDFICIQEAPSMAAGYNAAMNESDARYKVYLHQDVFIKNRHFIRDMLEVFAHDPRIGILGVIGKRRMGTSPVDMQGWDTGKVIFDNRVMSWGIGQEEVFAEVTTLVGMLLATRYDLPWREDVFEGWDFYDASQCMEFRRAGYKAVVPRQTEIWCCHDGQCSILTEFFRDYRRFLREYAGMEGMPTAEAGKEPGLSEYEINKEYEQEVTNLQKGLEEIFDAGEKEALRELFQDPDFCKIVYLREFEAIVRIDQMEEANRSETQFWNPGMAFSELMQKWRILKFALKRIEYGADDQEVFQVLESYSEYAVREACKRHITDQGKVYGKYLAERLEGVVRSGCGML